jgi:hypothetical protein
MRSDAVRTTLAYLLTGALLGSGPLVAADLAAVLSPPPLVRPSPVTPVGTEKVASLVPDATLTLASAAARVPTIASGPWVSPLYPQNGVSLWDRIWLNPETDPWDFLLGTAIQLHAPATAALMRSDGPDAEIPERYQRGQPTGDGDHRRDLTAMAAMIGRRHAATALTLQPYQLSLGPEVSPAGAATPEVRH